MSERKMIRAAIAGLLVIVLLSFGVSHIQQSAWSQGYMTGLLTAGGDTSTLAPLLAYGRGFGPMHAGIGFLGGILKLGFFLFFFAMLAKFFGFFVWRMRGEGKSGWHKGWHHGHHGSNSDATPQSESDASNPNDTQPNDTQPTSYVRNGDAVIHV